MAAETQTNGYDAGRVHSIIESILDEHYAIEAINESKAAVIAEHRGNIGAKYKEAKDAFRMSKPALKEMVKTILENRKREKRREDLDEEDTDALELVKAALGHYADTPLGRFALGENYGQGDDEGEEHLRSPAQKKREADRKTKKATRNDALDAAATSNGAEKLAGLKPLPH